MTLRVREEHEIGYFVHYHTLSGDFRRNILMLFYQGRPTACPSKR